jgi:hypothetical protein
MLEVGLAGGGSPGCVVFVNCESGSGASLGAQDNSDGFGGPCRLHGLAGAGPEVSVEACVGV